MKESIKVMAIYSLIFLISATISGQEYRQRQTDTKLLKVYAQTQKKQVETVISDNLITIEDNLYNITDNLKYQDIYDTPVKLASVSHINKKSEEKGKNRKEKTKKRGKEVKIRQFNNVDVPSNVPNDEPGCLSWKKTYEPYTLLTRWRQGDLQKEAYTDEETGIRMVDGRYCVAVGSYYAENVGDYIDVYMENGNIIPCIVADFKADIHTDKSNRYHTGGYWKGKYYEGDGSVIEFVVDATIHTDNDMIPKEFDGNIWAISSDYTPITETLGAVKDLKADKIVLN